MVEAIRLFVYCFAALGFAYVLGFSKISKPIREVLAKSPATMILVMLFECPACLGFWTGVCAVAFRFAPIEIAATIWNCVFFGLFTAGINLFLALRSGLIEGA